MTSSWKNFFWHNLGWSFHIWGQIGAVFDFSKWPPFWARDKLFYRKLYRKWNIPERWPSAFPTFWTFGRRSSSNIDGDISISKFDLLCDRVTSSMMSWKCIFIRPFEKRTYYAMAMSVRPSVRPSEFSGIFFNVLWDINLKLGICIQ